VWVPPSERSNTHNSRKSVARYGLSANCHWVNSTALQIESQNLTMELLFFTLDLHCIRQHGLE